MSEPYTPTTEQVLGALALCRAYGLGGLPECPQDETPEEAGNRWLANMKAEAWDQGVEATGHAIFNGGTPKNPYRKETTSDDE